MLNTRLWGKKVFRSMYKTMFLVVAVGLICLMPVNTILIFVQFVVKTTTWFRKLKWQLV